MQAMLAFMAAAPLQLVWMQTVSCHGDSVVFGQSLDDKDTIAANLQRAYPPQKAASGHSDFCTRLYVLE
jgi:hypothetical protein